MKIGFKSFNQIISYLFLKLSNLPMPGHWRWKILKHAGIKFRIPKTGKHFVYIGRKWMVGNYSICFSYVLHNIVPK